MVVLLDVCCDVIDRSGIVVEDVDAGDVEVHERVNVLLALAIGELCTPEVEKNLPRLLKNESQFVRIAAAKAVFQCKMN